MKNLIGGVIWTVVCASPLSVAAVPGADAQPAFRVESSELEVGPVTAGTIAVATFVFHNDGEAEVHILRAAPS
jgi:hypothetical protein